MVLKVLKAFKPRFKVEFARGKVSKAFKMFKNAKLALIEANKELEDAINQSNEKISEYKEKVAAEQDTINGALHEKIANERLASKLSEFISD